MMPSTFKVLQPLGLNESYYRDLSLIGAIVVFVFCTKMLYSIARTLYSCAVGYLELNVSWEEMGKWAVITGGTDGLGKAYAEALAQKGFSIILISRCQKKLDAVAEHIRNLYCVDTRVISVDFTDELEIYDRIRDEIGALEIGVLVNNVGLSYEYAEYFHAIPNGLKIIENLIRVNIASCTMMMKLILPQMERRKKGVIINLSSMAALCPVPLLAVYAACKDYVHHLTQAIQMEYKSKGIIVQSVMPGFVATNMSKIKKISLQVPLPETFVHYALKTVGTENYTYGYLPHKIKGYFYEIFKTCGLESITMNMTFRSTKIFRERYYRKLERSKKE